MVIVEAGIGAVVALLISGGFTKITQSRTEEGDTILSATRSDGESVNVQLKNNAIISPQFDFVRITASQTEASDENTPNYELKNESSVIKRIFALSIVPDATFKAEGFIKILLNDTQMFPITNLVAGAFQDVDAINIPIPDTYGLKILPKRKLKVFIWSATGAVVNATIAVFIGELP
jgi:hypothetical protein